MSYKWLTIVRTLFWSVANSHLYASEKQRSMDRTIRFEREDELLKKLYASRLMCERQYSILNTLSVVLRHACMIELTREIICLANFGLSHFFFFMQKTRVFI